MKKILTFALPTALILICGCMPGGIRTAEYDKPDDYPLSVRPEIDVFMGLNGTAYTKSGIQENLESAFRKENIGMERVEKRYLALKASITCTSRGTVFRPPLKLQAYETVIRLRMLRPKKKDKGGWVLSTLIPVPQFVKWYNTKRRKKGASTVGEKVSVKLEENYIIIACKSTELDSSEARNNSIAAALVDRPNAD